MVALNRGIFNKSEKYFKKLKIENIFINILINSYIINDLISI
jgi:hypothetical protein